MISFAVILPAAGASSRFGRNKLAEKLAGEPVIAHGLRAFTRRQDVTHVVVPTHNCAEISAALSESASSLPIDPRLQFCAGGASRAASVRNALKQLPAAVEWVAIHDAARPLVSPALIDDVLAAAVAHGAAAAALAVNLTIKQAGESLPSKVLRTIPRCDLWAMQTPQVMRRAELLDAFAQCRLPLEQITDDAQVLELAGREVWLVNGDARNIKITTPQDLALAELLLRG